MIENSHVTLSEREAKELLAKKKESDHFVATTFKDLYYTDAENELIDILRTNIAGIKDSYKRAIAMTALIRACTKKDPAEFLPIQEIGTMTVVRTYRRA